ncbi:MAG TPA: hypothetical protein VM686_04750 [Polyangiaceae bacterium]|nr:hypothetical protein [Polyangiaceae bacterium]
MTSKRLGSVLGLSFGVAVGLGCESSENPPPPAIPVGGSGSSGGSAGAAAGTAGASGGSGGDGAGGTAGDAGSSGTAGSAGSGGGCATECPMGGFCLMGECKCPADKPDICDNTCVSLAGDPDHCGVCTTACEPGAACVASACGDPPTELVAGTGCGVMRLAVFGTDLYWTEADSGKVRTIPLAGGTATDVATDQLKPISIAVDADGVYWSNEGDTSADSSTVMKQALPLSADPPLVLATGTATEPESPVIKAIAVADSTLYYTLVHEVHAISTDEAETADDVVGQATNLDIGPEGAGYPSGLALEDMYVIWTTGVRSGVERDTLAAGLDGYLELGESQGDMVFADIFTDGTNAYWATGSSIRYVSLEKTVGENVEDVTTTPDFENVTTLTIDATNVYFSNDGYVFKAPLTGGDAVMIARGQMAPTSMVVAGSTLYFATSDCAIRSLSLE